MTDRWTFAQLGQELVSAFEGTPFTVDVSPDRIRVEADLADAEFLALASAREVSVVHGLDITRGRDGKGVVLRDWEREVTLSAGVAKLSGEARFAAGRSWSFQRRIEWGLDERGHFGKQVDVKLRTADLRGRAQQVISRSGWRQGPWYSLPGQAKGAIVMAAIGAVGALVTVAWFLYAAIAR